MTLDSLGSEGVKRNSGVAMTRLLAIAAGCISLTALCGCRQDMQNQPKMYPQRSTTFFADGRSVRQQVPGTIARSQAVESDYFITGLLNGREGDSIPLPLTPELMARGQERYNIYCSPCHSRIGNGLGMIVQRGYRLAGNFHSERLREAPLGHFFQVITDGYGAMPNYAAEITPADRWAVVAYIRALQLSQNAKEADIDPGAKAAPLQQIEERTGFHRDFASQWPSTANQSTAHTVLQQKNLGVANGNSLPTPTVTSATPLTAAGKTKPDAKPAPAKLAVMVTAGGEVYAQNCQICHQANRLGLPPTVPSLIGIVDKLGAERIHHVVATGMPTGTPPMPPFPDLSPTDVDNLVAFLKASK